MKINKHAAQISRNELGFKIAHTESSDRSKISIEEADTTFLGIAFPELAERKVKVDAHIIVVVFGLKNIDGWRLLFPNGY